MEDNNDNESKEAIFANLCDEQKSIYRPRQINVSGWRFVDISIYAPEYLNEPITECVKDGALEGKGVFADITDITFEDEALDEFLCVEAYGLKGSFVTFLDELKSFGVVGGEKPFFSKDLTRGLFYCLKGAASILKEHTDKPQMVKNRIADIVRGFAVMPVWGLFLQILFLQGLCKFLEGVSIDEGDVGYNEAQSFYDWLIKQLIDKELEFCYKPYGDGDLERLKPFCSYLISTETGQTVQRVLFGNNEPKADLEPQQNRQQEKNKPTKGRGRPKETLKDKMIDDADGKKLQKMHDIWGDSRGKDAALIIVVCILIGWMRKPTYTQVKDEFGDIGNKAGYNRYLTKDMFTDEEIEGVKAALNGH